MRHTLILLRHAKSDWPDGVPDHERPLNKRGKRDAPRAGVWLVEHDRVPEHVVCSSSKRTRQTYGLAAEAFETSPEVEYRDDVYAASAGEMLEVIRATPETVRTLMLVAHNPGTQYLALALADDTNPELVARVHTAYPTNTLAVLEFDFEWAALDPGTASMVDVASPRG